MTIRKENDDSPEPIQDGIPKEVTNEKETPAKIDYKELIAATFKERDQIQQNRLPFERQWLVNIAFLYGKHYFSIEKMPKSGLQERIVWEMKQLEAKKKTRKTVNYILPLYRSLLARLLQFKQAIQVDPTTRQQRDVSAARVSQEVAEDFWQNVNKENPILCQKTCGMPLILSKLFQYLLVIGRGYLKPWFNPTAKAQVLFENLDNKPLLTAPVGAVEVEVEHPFNIFVDPMRRYVIQKKIMSVDTIEDIYGVKIDAEEIGLSEVEKQLMSLLEGTSGEDRFKNSAEILEKWELPSKKHPDGRLFVCSKKEMLLEPQPLPAEFKGRLAYYEFDYIDIMMAHPQGVIEQLIPSQEELNHTASRLHEYKKFMAGKVLVPDGCKLQSNYNDKVGQVIKYDSAGGKPFFDNPPNPPSFITREIDRIRRDMEDIASVHDISQGKVPTGVKSGAAIENLSELDNSQLSPQFLLIEQQLSFFMDTVLNIIEAKYKEPRLIGITGKDLSSEVRTFIGDGVAGNRRIKVSFGSTLPVSREARRNYVMELEKRGYISKEKAIELLEFGDLEGVFHSIDEQAERTEIQEILKGIVIEPQAWENHTRRIKVLTDFMMGEDFIELRRRAVRQDQQAAQIVQSFMDHRAKHQDFLTQEMQAMQTAGQAPAAPAGPPAA